MKLASLGERRFGLEAVVAACIVAPALCFDAFAIPIYQATASATGRAIVSDAGDVGASAGWRRLLHAGACRRGRAGPECCIQPSDKP